MSSVALGRLNMKLTFIQGVTLSILYVMLVAFMPLVLPLLGGGTHLTHWAHLGDWIAGAALPVALAAIELVALGERIKRLKASLAKSVD
jgi:hypothetical protein